MAHPIIIANLVRNEFHCDKCVDKEGCVWMNGSYPACEFNCDAYQYAEGMKKMASIISIQANVFFLSHQGENITKELWKKFNDTIKTE